ncbi:MAG: mechanosensitive ion channel family protein [Dehalococcoidia bacterium]|nr:mechanosensitive ion channel family protein [Dehalococcoidia bacterium]
MDWTPVIDWLASHGVRILIILLISAALYLALRRLVPRVVVHAVQRRMAKKLTEEVEKRTKTLSRALVWIGTVLIVVVAAFMILSEVGIDITPLLAGAGIVGIALGFGAQYLIRDLIAGLFVIIEDQYDVGDVVKLGDVSGIVEEINLRRTVLRDLDGIMHIIPNGQSAVASNYTRDWSRVNLNVSVAYGTDLDHAISVINRVCAEMAAEPYWKELILKAPEVLRVDNLGDSGIEIKILGDTKPIRQWEVMGELRKRIKKAFDEEGIEIPWPHTKVYFGNLPPQGRPSEAPPLPPEDG